MNYKKISSRNMNWILILYMFTEVAVSSTTCLCQADQCHRVRSKSGQPLEERQEKEAAVWTAREGLLGQGLLLLATWRISNSGSQSMLGDLLDDLAGERWGKMNLLFLVLPLHFGVKVHTLYLSFFLHGQNFWRKKFTPKNANFSR